MKAAIIWKLSINIQRKLWIRSSVTGIMMYAATFVIENGNDISAAKISRREKLFEELEKV